MYDEEKLPDEAKIVPLEIEEGLAVPSTEEAPAKPQQRTICQRHRGKFICLGVLLTLGAILGIAAAVLWPRAPAFTVTNESLMSIDLLGTNTAKLFLEIKNPNRFAISFSDMSAKVYNFEGKYVGTVSRPERVMVPAKSTEAVTATAAIPTSTELVRVGFNCLENNFETRIKIEATTLINLFNRQIKYTSTFRDTMPCLASNMGGGGGTTAAAGGDAGAAGAGAAPAPSAAQQLGNAIGEGINQIFGGGGGGGANEAGGPAAGTAPAPGAAGPGPA